MNNNLLEKEAPVRYGHWRKLFEDSEFNQSYLSSLKTATRPESFQCPKCAVTFSIRSFLPHVRMNHHEDLCRIAVSKNLPEPKKMVRKYRKKKEKMPSVALSAEVQNSQHAFPIDYGHPVHNFETEIITQSFTAPSMHILNNVDNPSSDSQHLQELFPAGLYPVGHEQNYYYAVDLNGENNYANYHQPDFQHYAQAYELPQSHGQQYAEGQY